jgi:hypothetical protein
MQRVGGFAGGDCGKPASDPVHQPVWTPQNPDSEKILREQQERVRKFKAHESARPTEPWIGGCNCGEVEGTHQAHGSEPADEYAVLDTGGVSEDAVDVAARAGQAETPAERIVAAAIQDGPVVYTAPHHHQIFRYVMLMGGKISGERQGFVTNRGRFVDRIAGRVIAHVAGQASSGGGLFSEELWEVTDYAFAGLPAPAPNATEPQEPGEGA